MKKSQAALEFLMTYGWALFIFMGAISTLYYLDVFSLDQFVVEKCEFSSNIYCIDGTYSDSQVQIVIQNGLIIDIENISVEIPNCAPGLAEGSPILLSGEQALYNLTCDTIYDKYIKSPIYLNYTNPDSGLTHRKLGNLLYKIVS